MIARGAAKRIVVKGCHGSEVARCDGCLARTHGEVPGKLGPERRLEGQILARHRHAGIGKETAGDGDTIIERLQSRRAARIGAVRVDLGEHLQ